MRVLAVINPGSGQAQPEAVEAAIRARFDDARVHVLSDGEDVEALVRSSDAESPDLVIASGGDGTVAGVANALSRPGTHLGIVPTGTANVLARELGIPLEVEPALDVIAAGHARPVDAMVVGDRLALCRIAFGLIGEVGQETTSEAKQRFRGLAYAWNALPRIIDSPERLFELKLDGRSLATRASCLIVTNVGLVGWGEMRWGPEVRADDGRIDVLAIHTSSITENLEVVWNALGGDVASAEGASHFSAARSVRVRSSAEVAVVADGEALPGGDVEIEVRPHALMVRAPHA